MIALPKWSLWSTPTTSEFRSWVSDKWYENEDERLRWRDRPEYTRREWFRNNRWFLKREFLLAKRSASGYNEQ